MRKCAFSVIFIFLIGCSLHSSWRATNQNLWKEFLDSYPKRSYSCFYFKTYFDLYSPSQTFRVILCGKEDRNGSFFLQAVTTFGSPLLFLQKNQNKFICYDIKENKVFVGDSSVDLFDLLNFRHPLNFSQLIKTIKGEFYKIFVDYSPSAQYESFQQVKFLFNTPNLTSLYWGKDSKDVKLYGNKPFRWEMQLKKFKKKTGVYTFLTLKYNDTKVEVRIKRAKFSSSGCRFKSILDIIPDDARVISIRKRGGDLWKKKTISH